MDQIYACYRLVNLIFHLMKGYLIIVFLFPFFDKKAKEQEVQNWAIKILDCFGIVVQVLGGFGFKGPLLIVSNHISWLDVLVLHSVGYCRFVAKTEIAAWPVVGFLSTKAGMLFIDRKKARSAIATINVMAEALKSEEVVAIFPEGTTSDGVNLLPFHSNLLEAAISAQAPVVPVAISYWEAPSALPSVAPNFTGTTTLVESVWRTLCAKRIVARLAMGEIHWAKDINRKQWALKLHGEVARLQKI
jgi:1-acyl-sn-glycerol-3-phosphate acyltransferase